MIFICFSPFLCPSCEIPSVTGLRPLFFLFSFFLSDTNCMLKKNHCKMFYLVNWITSTECASWWSTTEICNMTETCKHPFTRRKMGWGWGWCCYWPHTFQWLVDHMSACLLISLPLTCCLRFLYNRAQASLPGFEILPLRQFGSWGPEIATKFDSQKDTYVLVCTYSLRFLPPGWHYYLQRENFLFWTIHFFGNVK